MHSLNLKRINEKAPYLVTLNENDETYTFVTESGVEYSIGFMPDDLLQSDESYEFVIANLNDKKSPRDKKVKDTVVAIVEEFFNSNSATILYLCSTSDGKQLTRGRLFKNWFDSYEYSNRFTMVTSTLVDEYGIDNIAALIIRNDNPKLGKILAEFGQRQRMAIARAVVKKPEIYLFDDSFSALDVKTDKTLRMRLRESMGDSTMLIVAQRVGSILDADRILVMEDGQIVGRGKHRELLHTCPLYREIAELQLGEEEVKHELECV